MSLGDRCDEIVRLIDETLAAVAAESPGRLLEPERAAPSRPLLSAVDSAPIDLVPRPGSPTREADGDGAGPGWLQPFRLWPLSWFRPDPGDPSGSDGDRVASGF